MSRSRNNYTLDIKFKQFEPWFNCVFFIQIVLFKPVRANLMEEYKETYLRLGNSTWIGRGFPEYFAESGNRIILLNRISAPLLDEI